MGYQIGFREITRGPLEMRTVRGRHRQEVVLTGLHSFARYEITVRAFNPVGPGPPSTPLIVTTREGGR